MDNIEATCNFFNAYLCHVCKTKESFIHAKPCSSCKLICYCSREHQKADWESHKSICKAARSVSQEEDADDVFDASRCLILLQNEMKGMTKTMLSKSDWLTIRICVVKSIGDILKRQLCQREMSMLFLPKHCAVCFIRNIPKEFVCTNCFSAAYCSAEHQSLDDHKKVCSDFRKTLDIDLFMLRVNRNSQEIHLIKSKQAVNLKLDACDMKSFLANYVRRGLKFEEEVLFSIYYTSVLTFAYTINRIPNFTLGRRLTIHIVGATGECEGNVLEFWENLLHLFPKVHVVTLVHIGLDIDGPPAKLNLCNDCTRANRSVNILAYKQCYHEYHQSPHVQKPDVIIAFNSGLFGNPARFESGLFGKFVGCDPWERSLPFFFRYSNVPVILTEKSKEEAGEDLKRLLSTDVVSDKKVRVLVNCEPNPFNNLRPWNIWTDEDSTFPSKNSYVSVLMAESG